MEADLIVTAFAAKEGVYLSNVMTERGLGTPFSNVPPFGDNAEPLHIAWNSTYSSRIKHIARRVFYLKELVREGKIAIHHVATQNYLAGIATTVCSSSSLTKNTLKHLIRLMNDASV